MISFIVPTVGRDSLNATLASIELRPGDELIVIGPFPPHDPRVLYVPHEPARDWGATERTIGIDVASQPYLAFMDDDDVYARGARALQADAIAQTPERPVLFRMMYPNGAVLWNEPTLKVGNVSTQMFLLPNDPRHLGNWLSGRRESDYDFLASSHWAPDAFVWRHEVVCHRSWEASRWTVQ